MSKTIKNAFTSTIVERIPWKKASESSDIPISLNYVESSMYEAIEKIVEWTDCYFNNGDIPAVMDKEIEEFI